MVATAYYAKGIGRGVCQDTCVLEVMEKRRRKDVLLAVCDGIGGLQKGEYASQFVVQHIKSWFYEEYASQKCFLYTRKYERKLINSCTKMLYGCHTNLNQYGLHNNINLGTTVTMILLRGKHYILLHVGDSRAYLLGKRCKCITRDDIYKHNVLSKCIGSFPWRGVSIRTGKLHKRQGLFVCSDGIYKAFTEDEFADILKSSEISTERQLKKRISGIAGKARERGETDDQACVIVFAGMDDKTTDKAEFDEKDKAI